MAKKVKEVNKSLYERLRDLKFYCPSDEAGELFQTTCLLSYQMNGCGDSEKAELIFGWAKEQADRSREWCFEQGYELDDFITGDECL